MKRVLGSMTAVGILLSFINPAYSQASETEMRSFPIPPTSGYAQSKNFSYVGDYGYYLLPFSSSPGGNHASRATDYTYVRYTGVSGKKVWIYGTWGNTPIPAPVYVNGKLRDSCEHAHSSYGVWGKYELPFFHIRKWRFLGGGGMSGVRDSLGRCVVRVDNPLKSIDSRYGWGKDFLNFDFTGDRANYKEIVIGTLSNTHGWGSCNTSGFKACHEPSWIIGYTLR